LNRVIDLRKMPTADRLATPGNTDTTWGEQRSLDPHAVAFVTCVNDETQYATCLRYLTALQIPSEYSVERIAVLGATSMAEGYQRAMETSPARYKIYVHQDVYVVHQRLLLELIHLFRTYPRLGMVGVMGTTRLPASGIWWVNNASYAYGWDWLYVRLASVLRGISLLPTAYQRRLRFQRLRSFVGDYLPAVAVDGLLMATQYDLPWIDPLRGFMLYDQVQSLEFIKAGLEVGIARQGAIWCIHWGPLEDLSSEGRLRRESDLQRMGAAFRDLYPAFLGVPAQTLYKQYQYAEGRQSLVAGLIR
jgi:glycosyl transferase family 2